MMVHFEKHDFKQQQVCVYGMVEICRMIFLCLYGYDMQ